MARLAPLASVASIALVLGCSSEEPSASTSAGAGGGGAAATTTTGAGGAGGATTTTTTTNTGASDAGSDAALLDAGSASDGAVIADDAAVGDDGGLLDCATLKVKLASLIDTLKECALQNAGECQGIVQGPCCTFATSSPNSAAATEYAALKKQFDALGCKWVCPAMPCKVVSQTCVPDGQGGGVCN